MTYRHNDSPSILSIFLTLLILGAIATCGFGVLGIQYSDGTRTGTVTKLSSKGALTKSWEGEMVLGGVRAAKGGPVANTWDFTVTDQRVVEQLLKAVDDGAVVKVHYTQSVGYNPFTRDTSYTVIAVEEVAHGQ